METGSEARSIQAIRAELVQLLGTLETPVTEVWATKPPDGVARVVLDTRAGDLGPAVRDLVDCFKPRRVLHSIDRENELCHLVLISQDWVDVTVLGESFEESDDDDSEDSPGIEWRQRDEEMTAGFEAMAQRFLDEDRPERHRTVDEVYAGLLEEATRNNDDWFAAAPGWYRPRREASWLRSALCTKHRERFVTEARTYAEEIAAAHNLQGTRAESDLRRIVRIEMKRRDPGCATNDSVEPIVQELRSYLGQWPPSTDSGG